MGLVKDKLKRFQLQNLKGSDQRMVLAFEALFNANFLLPGMVLYLAMIAIPAGANLLFANGQAVDRTLYADLFAAIVPVAIVAISQASPGVVTWTAHNLPANTKISFVVTPGGSLPAPLVAGTIYFVKTVLTANTFTLSATAGGAAINTTTTGSGAITATAFPYGNGNGTTTFNVPNVPDVGGTHAVIVF